MNTYHANLCRTLDVPAESMETLIRAARTLHRWYELECGTSTPNGCSVVISRDEKTGKPFREIHTPRGAVYKIRTPDREAGALGRIAKVCGILGLHYRIQTDPRGAALRISRTPISADRYTDAAPVGG